MVGFELAEAGSLVEEGVYVSKVALEVVELFADGFPDLFGSWLLLFDESKEVFARFSTIGARLGFLTYVRGVQRINVGFGFFARVVE